MAFLVDTNVLLRLAASKDDRHLAARRAIEALQGRGEELVTTGQNLIETWNVAARPADRNGFGRTPEEANRLVVSLGRGFPRLAEPTDAFDRWLALVVRFGVSGVQVHDARLVAVMLAHEITDILTFDARDFQRYSEVGIRATNPAGF